MCINEIKAQHIQEEFQQQSEPEAYLDEIRSLENQNKKLEEQIEDLNSKLDKFSRDIDRKIEKVGDDLENKLENMMSKIGEHFKNSQ